MMFFQLYNYQSFVLWSLSQALPLPFLFLNFIRHLLKTKKNFLFFFFSNRINNRPFKSDAT